MNNTWLAAMQCGCTGPRGDSYSKQDGAGQHKTGVSQNGTQGRAHVSFQSLRQKHLEYDLRRDELTWLMYSECSVYGQLAPLALSLKQSRILWQGTCGSQSYSPHGSWGWSWP